MARKTLEERFWEKVRKAGPDECWEWTACKDQCGYGRIGVGGGKAKRAHRIALEWKLGRPLRDGYETAHTCDNPGCVNSNHLWEATHRENMLDSHAKDRSHTVIPTLESMEKQRQNTPRGDRHFMTQEYHRYQHEANGNSKLAKTQVDEIRRLRRDEGWTLVALAKQFGVTHAMIGFIVRGEVWLEHGQKRPEIIRPKRNTVQTTPLTMPQKGRRGEVNGNRKLTWEIVREIRQAAQTQRVTQEELGARYGVAQTTIGRILANRVWVETEQPPPMT